MAIIRKGDKEAEQGLKKRALEESRAKQKTSTNEQEKAGRKNVSEIRIDTKAKAAYTTELGNSRIGNAYDVVRKSASGPISGTSVASRRKSSINVKKSAGSGVISRGKVVKGGVIAKAAAKAQRKKKSK